MSNFFIVIIIKNFEGKSELIFFYKITVELTSKSESKWKKKNYHLKLNDDNRTNEIEYKNKDCLRII